MTRPTSNIQEIIRRLGYANSSNLYYRTSDLTQFDLHTIKLLKSVNPYAFYMVNQKPFVLFFDQGISKDGFKNICRTIWNAQIPVAFFNYEGRVKVFNGYSIDYRSLLLKEITEYDANDCDESSAFSYWSITQPLFWQEYSKAYDATRLNEILLYNIEFLTKKLRNEFDIRFANKIVLRLIFICYLIDRGVDIGYKGFSVDEKVSRNALLEILKSSDEMYALFEHLKHKFNGNLFELEDGDNSDVISPKIMDLLRSFLARDECFVDCQLSMFPLYDFNIIPVELISNIYEILLSEEEQQKEKAFYTPGYLVDYILNKTVGLSLEKKETLTVLDPSCGSGIFLVKCYRMIIEKALNGSAYTDNDTWLCDTLINNIFGIDKIESAVDVSIFSLYLTVLDYKDPKSLDGFILPNLKDKNLIVSNFFDRDKTRTLEKIRFDYIIGNPPWGSVKDELHIQYCIDNGFKAMQQNNNEISRSFVLRAKDFCDTNTRCCFILHSKLLYTKKAPAPNFRKYLLKHTIIEEITEMSSVRKLLFKDADAPAFVITFRYSNDYAENTKMTYIAFKPNIYFKLFHIIAIEKNDIKYVNQRLLTNKDWAWKTLLYGFSWDIETIAEIKKRFPTIKSVISKKLIYGTGVQYHDGELKDAKHLVGRNIINSDTGIDHFRVRDTDTEIFTKLQVHRPRKKELFEPPYCMTLKGVDCATYKMKSAYSEQPFVCKETIYVIKGTEIQKPLLLNLVALFNSELFSYFNLMLGSSIGVEREQRFMKEVFEFPYVFSDKMVEAANIIQQLKELRDDNSLNKAERKIAELDNLILHLYGLTDNVFVDYALHVQIPQVANMDDMSIYRPASCDDMIIYSKCFQKSFSDIYKYSGKYIHIKLYPHVANNYAAFELSVCVSEPSEMVEIIDAPDRDKEFLTRFSVYKVNDHFFEIKDVVSFGESSFFILKSNCYKNWHPAMAHIDLSEIMSEILLVGEDDQT